MPGYGNVSLAQLPLGVTTRQPMTILVPAGATAEILFSVPGPVRMVAPTAHPTGDPTRVRSTFDSEAPP